MRLWSLLTVMGLALVFAPGAEAANDVCVNQDAIPDDVQEAVSVSGSHCAKVGVPVPVPSVGGDEFSGTVPIGSDQCYSASSCYKLVYDRIF